MCELTMMKSLLNLKNVNFLYTKQIIASKIIQNILKIKKKLKIFFLKDGSDIE